MELPTLGAFGLHFFAWSQGRQHHEAIRFQIQGLGFRVSGFRIQNLGL
jgi:hypothetical protein